MKLKFKNQDFQEAATAAVCDVFEGQPYHDPNVYTVDPGRKGVRGQESRVSVGSSLPGFETLSQVTMDFQDEPEVGYKNAEIKLPIDVLRENLHRVQNRQNLERTKLLGLLPELEVEMETGTGKTFVYTKTIFELNKRFGWSKFIIIVPGIAIREGVKKSLEITAEKFLSDYGKSAKVYVYNSAHPQDVLDFSTNADIQVIVMNVQAFNARGKDARRIFMELDEFASRRPIDLIAANRPILILDEPQKMEGKAMNEMLPKFNPLMILRYSATHKSLRNLVYKLDAIDAFENPRFFHIGFDEESHNHQRRHSISIVRQGDLWWHDFLHIVNAVERKGVRAWCWSDKIWHAKKDFLNRMPKSVLQSNWYYGRNFELNRPLPKGRECNFPDAYVELEKAGFDQIPTGSNWSVSDNLSATVAFAKKNISPGRLKGFLAAPWVKTLPQFEKMLEEQIDQMHEAMELA